MTIVGEGRMRPVVLFLAAALLVSACGATTSSAAPSASPVVSASTGADLAGGTPAPSSTPWPGDVPNAIIGLGEVDTQIEAAGRAMDAAIQAKDVAALGAAANGLVILLDKSADLVKTAQGYAGTKALADADAAAFAQIRAGAADVVAGTKAGDGPAVNAGVTAMAEGITAYAAARRGLSALLEQAIAQKKKYVK
jgi:hypothetical protein